MLTKQEITDASTILDETDILMIIPLIRNSNRYKVNPALFYDFETKLQTLNGTTKAKQINAILDKIEELGIGEATLQGLYGDALNYSQTGEREAMVNYIIAVLYQVYDGNYLYDANDPNSSLYSSGNGLGQRDLDGEFI